MGADCNGCVTHHGFINLDRSRFFQDCIASIFAYEINTIKKNILAVIRKQSTELDWENFITVIANFAQSTTGAKYIWQTEYYWLISEYLGQNKWSKVWMVMVEFRAERVLCYMKYLFLTRNWTFQLSIWISFPFFIFPHFKSSTKVSY